MTEIDGSPYPSSSRGPIYTFNEAATYLKGRHTFKAGVLFEYSGEDDFDQINVSAVGDFTNNQNGRFTFRNARQSPARASATLRSGLFSSYAEIGRRALTRWRALSTDVFAQDTWRPTNQLTIEGGVRWVYWPPFYALENNAASFDPAYYNTANQAVIDPHERSDRVGTALQRDRAAGRRVPELGEQSCRSTTTRS